MYLSFSGGQRQPGSKDLLGQSNRQGRLYMVMDRGVKAAQSYMSSESYGFEFVCIQVAAVGKNSCTTDSTIESVVKDLNCH